MPSNILLLANRLMQKTIIVRGMFISSRKLGNGIIQTYEIIGSTQPLTEMSTRNLLGG
jgi:hypothetical protein